ncbi:MAG: ABC transporter ATP-binding protein [Nitrospirae bacterium]|nr:ABC transporter ATP-binding protein [Nitrospirota bacterium]
MGPPHCVSGAGALLAVQGLSVSFGGIRALDGVGLHIHASELLALIGPNGSGKTTLFNCISGVYRANQGEIRLDGRLLTGLRPDEITAFGIARTFQNIRLVHTLTVIENILLGRHRRLEGSWPLAFLGFLGREVEHRRKAEEIIEFLGLEAVRKARAGEIPFGVQRKVELARALALEPRLLLLDEPAAGLTTEEKQELVYYLREIRGRLGPALLLVEHDLALAAAACDRMMALNSGRVLAEGTAKEVQNHPEVRRAYVG